MPCLFCGKTVAQAGILYRINPTGRPGVFACSEHIKNTDAEVDPEVKEISEILSGAKPNG